jgi:probable DNA repair protein
MSISLFDTSGYSEKLQGGGLILTPNRRIRAKMLQSFAQSQREKSATWDTPNVHSLEGWIQTQFEDALYETHELDQTGTVLSADQEISIWEHIIAATQAESGILNPRAAAEQAAKAYKTLSLWQEDIDPEVFADTDATEAFSQWVQSFESTCELMNVLPAAKVAQSVLEAYQQGTLSKIDEMTLVGFDDVPPVYESIVALAAETVVREEVLPVPEGKASVVAAFDERDEVRLAAMWAQTMVRDGQKTVGVIVPDLGQRRDEVHRVFSEILDPHHLCVDVNNYAPVFNISAGEPLFSQPLVSAALDLLAINRQELDADVVKRLMMSPLIGGGVHESKLRGQAWRKIAEDRARTFKRDDLIKRVEHAPDLQKKLADAVLAIADPDSRKLPSQWAQDIGDQLDAIGWPGDIALNSIEYQTVRAFHRVLHEMAGNDAVLENITLSKAVSVLGRLVRNTPFQPETKDSPVQILGALEGAGLNFDCVWVMGMRDDRWPAAPAPTPFIPVAMQRACSMPNASPERELAFARSLTDRFSQAGYQVIFSYPQSDKDNELAPSSLVARHPEVERSTVTEGYSSNGDFWSAGSGASLTTEVDVSGHQPVGAMKGGVGLFKDYALCAFRGYARNRMGIKAIEEPEEGVSHAVRGQLSHGMMYHLWKELKDHETLIERMQSPEDLDALLQSTAEHTVENYERSQLLSEPVKRLEIRRLCLMAMNWLRIDAGRSPFKVVEMEEAVEVDVHGVQLKIKRDRVDELQSGGEFVIDYKENAPSLAGWDPETLHEPQVPIGALTRTTGKTLSGVALGALNRDKANLSGYTSIEDEGSSLKSITAEEMDEMRQGWDEALKGLSAKILAGDLTIDPINQNKACSTCELKAICRHGLKSSLAA